MYYGKHPDWLRKRSPDSSVLEEIKGLCDGLDIHTVCESAQCPNQGQCFSQGTATFLIMGNVCTRNCSFCAIEKGHPEPLDPGEPDNIAEAVEKMHIKHVVITSVTRDDLPDGGARHFARAVEAIQEVDYNISVEVLIPDFQGNMRSLETVANTFPDVINHNIETVPRLYSEVRARASYQRSLDLLKTVKELNPGIITKSGLMLGLGEQDFEVIKAMQDLRDAECNCLTLGQYLPPSTANQRLVRYVTPDEFEEYEGLAMQMGFSAVRCGPFVRSSFEAMDMYKEVAQ